MTIKAHFDGKVLVPDEPVNLETNQKVEITIQPLTAQEEEKKYITGEELAKSEIVGMWADRKDIKDNLEFARELRRRAGQRARE